MKKLTRREFLGKSSLGVGSALLLSRMPAKSTAPVTPGLIKMPVGFQVWTIKDMLVKDFPGTLKKMKALGFDSMEMCSPPGYESSGFGPLIGMKAAEMKKIVSDAGLICESSHYVFDELKNHLDERIEFALESGQKQIILSSFWIPEKAPLSDWLRAAGELNRIGEKTKKAGLQTGYHNHHMEFATIDGTLIYDALMKELDPEYVKMQFQVAVISIGYKAVTYFNKYPGRFISAHLADWSPENKKEAPIGKGIVDWKELFASSDKGGVKNIFVEMGMDTFKESAAYLHSL